MRKILLAVALVTFGFFAFAEDPAQKPLGKTPVQEIMDRIFTHFAKLSPFLVSSERFSDPKNASEIGLHVQGLADAAKQVTKHHQLMTPGLRLSRQVLETQLSDANAVFKSGNKSYARWMLASSLSICMSCHTQLPTTKRPFADLMDGKVFTAPFEQAELTFVLRDFDSALRQFSALIAGYPENKLTLAQLETAFQRKVAIFARVKRDPAAGITSLTADDKNKGIPEFLRKNIKAWVALFKEWKREPAMKISKLNDDAVLKFAREKLKPGLWDKMVDAENPRTVSYLRVSGVLFEYLSLHPSTKVAGEILYWLAICDRGLNNNFFYSLADLYLRDCMTNFSSDPIAKNCFKEYEDYTVSSYSGSSGVNLPANVSQEIERYRTLVNKAN